MLFLKNAAEIGKPVEVDDGFFDKCLEGAAMHKAYEVSRAVQAGRVWVNSYHAYPAHASFGGYQKSGIGRKNHKMMLNHYRQGKNMLISCDKNKLGFLLKPNKPKGRHGSVGPFYLQVQFGGLPMNWHTKNRAVNCLSAMLAI